VEPGESGATLMEAYLKKFVDTKLGDFLQVDEENLEFSPSTGHLCLRNAELKADTFNDIHVPFTLRGGFIEEMSVNVHPSAFSSGGFGGESKKPVSVLIKNVFMVFGPQLSDWSWEHVYICKTRLVDMIGKLLDLKDLKSSKRKKNKKPTATWNFFGEFKKRMVERMFELFMDMVEVRVSNIHFRYEDVGPSLEAGPKLQHALPSLPLGTNAGPLACGCKLAYMEVKSKPSCGQECRATGYWKYSSVQHASARFSQTITTRRMSVYWDVNKNLDRFFATSSSSGAEVKKRFQALNTRATFSDCVVETILGKFGPDHPRRGSWEGPTFRERFDFHRYMVFPSGFNAHIRTNRDNEATQKQLVPLKDADVCIDSVEVAVDTEQLRSMNALLSHVREFDQKDRLSRTRPRESILAYLSPPQDQGAAGGSQGHSSSSTSPAPGYISAERIADKHAVIRSWWRHALNAVQIRCGTPRSCFKGLVDERLRLREQFIDLYLQELARASRDPMASSSDPSRLADRLRELQVRLSLDEILKWRTMAKDKYLEISSPPVEEVEDSANSAPSNEPAARSASNTMQMQVHLQAFQAFFLVVDKFWALALQETMLRILKNTKPHQKVKALMPRSVLAKTQVLHICVEAVQKGRSRHRVARWLQIAFGTISVINCTIPRHLNGSRHILCMTPSVRRAGEKPVSMLFGFTELQVLDNQLEAGDVPLAAVIDPAAGVAAHLEEHTAFGDDRLLEHVGFLGGKVLAPRTLSFVSVQAGQVRALYYSPFFDRIWHFLKQGRASLDCQLTRRPSVNTLDRDLLVKLQRKFEFYAGKSTLYNSIEGVVGGMQARMVDTYNNTHALCKEVILTPMRLRFLRSGNPQRFQIQIHKVRPADEQPGPPVQVVDTLGLLPWQVSMHLLPREHFFTYAEAGVHEKYVNTQQQDRASDSRSPTTGPVVSASDNAFDAVAEGSTFKKWCRTGRWKERFVKFQDDIEAIVWKKNGKAQTWLGILPLSKLQDVCTGIETPVMKKCKDQANADCVWSLVAVDRTLDLQADSRAQRDLWVAGIKARFKLYVTQRCKNESLAVAEGVLPRHLTQLVKVYPQNFWSGKCALRRTYYKLQAVTTVGKTLEASKAPTLAGRFVGRHHRTSQLQVLGKEVPSTEVASTRQVPKYGLHTKL